MAVTIELKGLAELEAKMKAMGSGLEGVRATIANPTSYGPWVGSERFQAGVHRRRWPTDERVVEEQRGEIEKDFQAAVDAAVEAPGRPRANPLVVAARAAMLRLQDGMTDAPAPPSGSTYRRTNTYIRAWTTRVEETRSP